MTHWRTSRATSGAQPLPGSPHDGKYAPPANLLLFPSGTPFERREIVEPPLDEDKSFTHARLFLILIAPSFIALAFVVGYLAFVA